MRPKHRVRVYVQDGPTIEGILAARTKTEYVIWAPKILDPQQKEPVELSGHIEVPRERVLYYQIVG